jgi:Uma2 family endonuclease
LVLEVTSSRPDVDRDAKRRAYAAAGIPLYLLVDRQREHVTLFQHPAGEDYSSRIVESFGGSLDIPEPFSLTLETADFL